jgi:hypothetical protein
MGGFQQPPKSVSAFFKTSKPPSLLVEGKSNRISTRLAAVLKLLLKRALAGRCFFSHAKDARCGPFEPGLNYSG